MYHLFVVLVVSLYSVTGLAVDKNLTYQNPDQKPDASEIAQQVYFVNHHYAFANLESAGKKTEQLAIYHFTDKLTKPSRVFARRYLSHDLSSEGVKSRDLVHFTSGKQRGVGILVTDFQKQGRPMGVSIWLPALRKVRTFTEPEHHEIWGGSILTYGDIYLRRPDDEVHELIAIKQMDECAVSVEYEDETFFKKNRIPSEDCTNKGKTVYLLKSLHKQKNWWYEYRLRWIDKKHYTDYRTEYFKDGKRVKLMTKSWYPLDKSDPRATLWHYWYVRDEQSQQQSLVVLPRESIKFNTDRKERFWSEATLRKLR